MNYKVLFAFFVLAFIGLGVANADEEKHVAISESGVEIEVKQVTGNFNVACMFCKRNTLETNVGYSNCLGCQAWRCFQLETKHYMMKYIPEQKKYVNVLVEPKHPGYLVYMCQHGHTFYLK